MGLFTFVLTLAAELASVVVETYCGICSLSPLTWDSIEAPWTLLLTGLKEALQKTNLSASILVHFGIQQV